MTGLVSDKETNPLLYRELRHLSASNKLIKHILKHDKTSCPGVLPVKYGAKSTSAAMTPAQRLQACKTCTWPEYAPLIGLSYGCRGFPTMICALIGRAAEFFLCCPMMPCAHPRVKQNFFVWKMLHFYAQKRYIPQLHCNILVKKYTITIVFRESMHLYPHLWENLSWECQDTATENYGSRQQQQQNLLRGSKKDVEYIS